MDFCQMKTYSVNLEWKCKLKEIDFAIKFAMSLGNKNKVNINCKTIAGMNIKCDWLHKFKVQIDWIKCAVQNIILH